MAHIRTARRQDGTPFYRALWYVESGGKRRQMTKSFAKRSEAKAYAAKMETEIEQKGVGDPDKHDLGRYLKRWLATLRASGDHSPTTLVNYEHHIRRISEQIGTVPLAKLTAADIDACYGRLLIAGLSRGTVRATHSVLTAALSRARKWKLIAANPAEDATAPKANQKPVRVLSRDEAARVLAEADRRRRRDSYPGLDCIVHLALGSGLRRGEILGLAWDAVDLAAGTISVKRVVISDEQRRPMLREGAKTAGSIRTVSLAPELIERLREHKIFTLKQKVIWGREYWKGPMLCFPAAGGGPMPPQNLADRLRKILAKAGVTGAQPLHVFRHTHASWLMAAKTNPKAVSKRLGHSSAAFTLSVYTHPGLEEDRAAAATIAEMIKTRT
jgi:integrase